MSTDSTKKTIGVALGVCLVCSILVSSAAVSLHSIQEKNKRLDRFKNILAAAGLDSLSGDVVDIYNEKVDPIIIDLSSGEPVPESEYDEMLDPATFNIQALADNPQYSESVPDNEDIAGINRRPKVMAVYQVKSEGQVQKFVLPIYGKGLWSTLYGFITLDRDLNTVRGITFYEHGETPGLGGEVDNPKWKNQWNGKTAFDEQRRVRITVLKGIVDPTNPASEYQVDGLSGSTITSRGVDQLVKYWLSENGYGPFFDYLKENVLNG